MTKYLLLAAISAAALVGCAASPPPGPTAPTGSVPGVMDETRHPSGAGGFASRADCDKLVDHIDSIVFLSGHEQDAFRAPNQDPDWHRARVDECTITVDQYNRACLLRSGDVSTAARCNSRFFADTLRAYRDQ